ncbi:Uncharacterised protein [Mycobacteroides abscessus]|nr:Uncharacterised protein [Mycobacteroides abscessus]
MRAMPSRRSACGSSCSAMPSRNGASVPRCWWNDGSAAATIVTGAASVLSRLKSAMCAPRRCFASGVRTTSSRSGRVFIAVGAQRTRSQAAWICASVTGSAENACVVCAARNRRSAACASIASWSACSLGAAEDSMRVSVLMTGTNS